MDPGVLFWEIEFLDPNIETHTPPTMDDEITMNSHIYRSRYCKTCNINWPPKASHCGMCNNCVMEFDQ